MSETPDNLCRINWRIGGSLANAFAKFSDDAARRFLLGLGGDVQEDARANLQGKGWKRLGPAIAQTLNTQVSGRKLEVGASHAVAGIRHFGGKISAPGQGPLAKQRQALTIPLRGSPAEGQTAGDMRQGGWTLFRPKGTRVLMGSRGKGDAVPLFALAKSVNHPASPWFPTFEQITGRMEGAFRAML